MLEPRSGGEHSASQSTWIGAAAASPSSMIHLVLSREEGQLLLEQLALRVQELDDELVHTDRPELQHALLGDVERLRALTERLGLLLPQEAAARSAPQRG
jgi:hypothetical protein